MNVSLDSNPPFCSQVRASGLGEIWTHAHDELKFGQFGWRCGNKETSYGNGTLIGNWNEQRFDIEKQKKAKRLPSQYEHYFDSTYAANYNTTQPKVPESLRHLKERHSNSFPGHAPELDSPQARAAYNSWATTSRSSYVDPRARTAPLNSDPTTSQ